MPFKILTLNNIALAGLRRFPRERYEVASDITRPDGVLLRSHNMHGMEIPASVQAVARAGAGVNNIPVDTLSERGVPVFNTPGANANAVKELVLAGLFLAARNLIPAADYVRKLDGTDAELSKAVEAGKKQFVGFELPTRTLGVVGLGAIGVEVANAALGLDMQVIGYDPKITVQRAWQMSRGVEKAVNLDDLFTRADVVTVHTPLNDDTRSLINRDRLKLLPRNSVLLNFAREGVVDVDAVIEALDAGQLSHYVTDFPTTRLKEHPKAICLPHLGASTREAEENCAVMAAESLKEYLEQGNIRNSVNFPEAVLPRDRPDRLAIPHLNVPNMVAQILSSVATENINVSDMLNVSRGGLSYTVVDLDGPASEETLQRIRDVKGILSVRVVPVIES
ncbi:MAG: 3-phosphoglycerate dehydrogenase [Gammaproteobacteria bacterium]|nr:3-phosphoglycerate dehydrogenase [Gammaproteobacteria bacterium]